jgi:hypothetical protein
MNGPTGAVEVKKVLCPGAEVFLTGPKGGKVGEVFVRAQEDGVAKALAAELGDFLAQPPGAAELAYVRYDGALKVTALTLSQGEFSWDLLPGATYEDKLKEQARRNPEGVQVSVPIRLMLPDLGQDHLGQDLHQGRAVVTTFVFGGAHAEGPGPSIVHVLGDDGKPVARIPARFPGAFGGLAGSFTPQPLGSKETALKYSSSYVGQGVVSEHSFIYRLDVPGRKLALLALAEGGSSNLQSPACLGRGDCREIRYALIPANGKGSGKSQGDYFTFNVDRVEIRHDKKGAVLKAQEKVIGACVYDDANRDYRCPKLPADAGS